MVLVASTNTDGTSPDNFALKAKGMVVSGELYKEEFNVDAYEKFLQLEILDGNLTEIVSVADSEGNVYYEVDYLSQDVIYVPILNTNADKEFAKNILKPVSVPRRFVAEHGTVSTILQFGYGTEDNEDKVLDPTSVILDIFGRDHITDKSFDPTVLTKTTKLGIVPSNTVITVVYRRNSVSDVNVQPDSIVRAVNPVINFIKEANLDINSTSTVLNSLELTNEKSITGDATNMSSKELKLRAQSAFAAQNRAVTKEDYISLAYNMPSNFGQIKKASITKDETSFNGKNLNLYVISANTNGQLATANDIIKQNLRTWISRYKMIGDTIDILDSKVVNLEIKFSVVGFANVNKYDVINDCVTALSSYYASNYYDIGEPFKITDVYKMLNNISSVVDTKNVEVTPKTGPNYSDFGVSFEDLISDDGRYLIPMEDTIFEIKFPDTDITGEVV